ncbi:transporter substrate-binding domain-containing protein [Pararhodobacter oceanensis]|uniref:Ectoine/hydroxyectoine ABC transporter substrate-binding protein EhuB n=1 Tax=Pararhodobacter oceanensis TaxID=2172121 RepID=A0A2T8HPD8_9RHOB|nr:transporter substrate-binding domain-containing protein [Pararhodobacter oceanensis]PVH27308.1 ectoine/hydroxyectoine ABC transporter substrate-binding protein EhuB [Pararhodobacter oceanensis]
MTIKSLATLISAGTVLAVSTVSALAGPLADRIEAGEPIRIGFSNIPVFGYPDENGEPKGFANEIALGILAEMGLTNVEGIVTDWGGLIPGLMANRYDIITGGQYILGARCENVSFSEPIAQTGDAFLVPAGNPQNLTNYQDILNNPETILAMYAGGNHVDAARREGLGDAQMMQLPGPSEALAALRAGRADAAALTSFEAFYMADRSDGLFVATDPAALPEWTLNWVGIGFRDADADFLAQFNAAHARYMGSDEMMAAMQQYGYVDANLPGDTTTEWACANR